MRPVLTGDVFADVEVPGAPPETGLAMVVAHPCTMRKAGGALRDHLAVSRIRNYPQVQFEQWRTGHFRVLPLPDLTSVDSVAADFELIAPVHPDALALDRRVACLSDYGLGVLQQRRVHHDTRVVVDIDILHAQMAPNLEEADLLHQWLEELVNDVASDEEIAEQTSRFNEFLGPADSELRTMLLLPINRADVRRRVRQEIGARKAG